MRWVPNWLKNSKILIGKTQWIQFIRLSISIQLILDDVHKLVKQICLFKASGIDHLSTKVLKDAFLILTDQITYMFNLSLGNGTFPDAWKRATIIPLQKEGNTDDVNNLRPISLLPLPGKLLEKIVHGQIINYLEDNKLLTDRQAGFRVCFCFYRF